MTGSARLVAARVNPGQDWFWLTSAQSRNSAAGARSERPVVSSVIDLGLSSKPPSRPWLLITARLRLMNFTHLTSCGAIVLFVFVQLLAAVGGRRTVAVKRFGNRLALPNAEVTISKYAEDYVDSGKPLGIYIAQHF